MNPFLLAMLPTLFGSLGGALGFRKAPSIDQLFQQGLRSAHSALAPARHGFSVANAANAGAMRQNLQSGLAARGGFSTGAGQVGSALADSAFGMSEATAETQFRQSVAELAMQQLQPRLQSALTQTGSRGQAALGGLAGILGRPEFAELLSAIFPGGGSRAKGAQTFFNQGVQ